MQIERPNGYGLAKPWLNLWIATVLILSLALAIDLFSAPLGLSVWREWAAYTARLSFVFFLAAYTASPLYALSQNRVFTFLRQNRRNAGIGFALAHTIHLAALSLYLMLLAEPISTVTLVVGLGAYAAMFAMWATSSDGAIRKIGPALWRRLHKFGIHYLAFVFLFTYSSAAFGPAAPPLLLPTLIWLAVLLRISLHFCHDRESKSS
jgi:sulfoxide reductase heme-binding subunit YedZ